jgi:hypothetical protein
MKKFLYLIVLGTMLLAFVAPAALAVPIDLTDDTNPATFSGITASDGSIWRVVIGAPTGTGVYEPFLRLQANGTEAGLNTDAANPGVYDDVGGIWTHSLMFGDLATVVKNSSDYYQFTFDINEPASGAPRFISLDVFQIYSGSIADATSTAGLTLLYDFGNSSPDGPPVLLDYTLASSGSGNDDIEVLIPYFSEDPASYFYLYVEFGGEGDQGDRDYRSQDGFEEVRALLGTPLVPEPLTMLLLGVGLIGLAGIGRKLKE